MILLHPDRRQFIDVHALSRKRLILDTPCCGPASREPDGPQEEGAKMKMKIKMNIYVLYVYVKQY